MRISPLMVSARLPHRRINGALDVLFPDERAVYKLRRLG
jgi:hypothetical protein